MPYIANAKYIAIVTEDFHLYYEMAKALKEDSVPFLSLSIHDDIPSSVGVVITSPLEFVSIDFPRKVRVDKGAWYAITQAQWFLRNSAQGSGQGSEQGSEQDSGQNEEWGKELYIGIDPGERPGLAVVVDGAVLKTAKVSSPEEVAGVVKNILSIFNAQQKVVRVGHGDPTRRNRVINAISRMDKDVLVEIVNEERTTKRTEEPDIQAAIEIAFIKGTPAKKSYELSPTDGEVRDLQRRSRIKSKGRLTISHEMAVKVACGEVSLEDAVQLSGAGSIDG